MEGDSVQSRHSLVSLYFWALFGSPGRTHTPLTPVRHRPCGRLQDPNLRRLELRAQSSSPLDPSPPVSTDEEGSVFLRNEQPQTDPQCRGKSLSGGQTRTSRRGRESGTRTYPTRRDCCTFTFGSRYPRRPLGSLTVLWAGLSSPDKSVSRREQD